MIARLLLVPLIVAISASYLLAQDRLTPELLKQVKGATVLVTAGSGANQRSGSGFFIHVKDSWGFVATNAHVAVEEGKARPTDVKCILHSGTEQETKLDGDVVSCDFQQDLALIKVKHDKLPTPLSLTALAEVYETQSIFTVGFPFGELLGAKDTGVNHTIARSSVSSLRTNERREVELIQLDGGLNPGNSGGPVIDVSGKLVGMAVAKVRGSEIGFAIPAARVATLLQGQATIESVTLGSYDVRSQQVEVVVDLVDPLGAIVEIRGYAFQSSEVEKQDSPATPNSKRQRVYGKLAGENSVPTRFSKTAEGAAKANLQIKLTKDPPNYVQVALVTADGKERFLPPRRVDPSLKSTPQGWSESEPSREWQSITFAAPPAAEQTLKLPGRVTDVVPAGGGRFLIFPIAEQQKAVVLDLSKCEFCGELQVPKGSHIAAGRDEILIGPTSGKLLVWSLPDLKPRPARPWNRRGDVISLKQGWNAAGPLIAITAQVDDKGSFQSGLSLLNPRDLQPLKFDAMRIETRLTDEFVVQNPHGEFFCPEIRATSTLQVRTSGLGWDFAGWDSTEGLWSISVRGKWLLFQTGNGTQSWHGHYLLNPTGTVLMTGIESRRLVGDAPQLTGIYLPTFDPDWQLTIPKFKTDFGRNETTNWRLMNVRERGRETKLPRLDEHEPVKTDSYGKPRDGLAFDQRFYWSPQAEVLVSIPPGNDRVVLRPLPKPGKAAASSSLPETSPIPSRPPPKENAWLQLNAQGVGVAMPEPTFTPGDVPLGGLVRHVCQGGGGRYLVLTLDEEKAVAVCDLVTGKVIKTITVEGSPAVAAGLTKLVVIGRQDFNWRQWDFKNLDAEPRTGILEIPGGIKQIALGSASEGPLAIGWEGRPPQARTESRPTHGVGLIDLATMQPLRLPSTASPVRRNAVSTKDGEPILDLDTSRTSIDVSARGNYFIIGHNALQVFPDAVVLNHIQNVSPRPTRAIPAADSKLIITSNGIFSADFKVRSLSGQLLPTCHSKFALRFTGSDGELPTQGTIIDVEKFAALYTLPDLPEMKRMSKKLVGGLTPMKLESRYFFVPQLQCLATIPPTNDRIVLRETKIPEQVLEAAMRFERVAVSSSRPEDPAVPAASKLLPAPPSLDLRKPVLIRMLDGLQRVTSAGHGKYLCVQSAKFDRVIVYNLTTASGVADLKISSDAILAGYADGLIAITPEEQKLEIFAAPDFKLKHSSIDPRWGKVCEASAGFASDGPLWTVFEGEDGRPAGIQLFEIATLKPWGLESARKLGNQVEPLPVDATGRIEWRFQGEAMPTIRAAGVGSSAVFTDFSKPKIQQFVVRLTGRKHTADFHTDPQHHLEYAELLPDGKRIAYAKGLISASLTDPHAAEYCLPTLEANCYISRQQGAIERWQVRDSETHAVLATLPDLGAGRLRFFTDRRATGQFKPEVNVRERLFVLPSSGVMAVVPRTNNEIVIQRFQLDTQPSIPFKPIQTPATPKAEAPKLRTWTDASGKFQVEATLISRDANQVRLQRKDGQEIVTSLDRLSPADQEYLRMLPSE